MAGPNHDGPVWTKPGLDLARGRYPLRVEAHVGRMVDGLLPGIITTTWHPRTFALHALAWAEADSRKLARGEAEDLVRRCEVVLAGIWLTHPEHARAVPRAHGSDRIEKRLEADGACALDELAKPGVYAEGERGFAGVYYASEVQLGLLAGGWPPKPAAGLDLTSLRDALGRVVELAGRDRLGLEELAEHGDLCVCHAAEGVDGDLLRQVMALRVRGDKAGKSDSARIATVRLLAQLLRDGVEGSIEAAFRRRYGSGSPGGEEFHLAAWRGTILRSYSVGAWRRLWSWIVDQMDEPRSVAEVASILAARLESDTVGDLLAGLPEGQVDDRAAPAEEELRADGESNPADDIRLLALGASRLSTLGDGPARDAFIGEGDADDLGPIWTARWLEQVSGLTIPVFARQLVELLVRRAERIALEKMEMRSGKAWVPSRLRERDGLYWAAAPEPAGDVALRVETLGLVMLALGVFERNDDRWSLGGLGEAYAGV